MGYNLLKYLLALLFIFTSLNALDDKDKNLNLIAPTNLNRIEGNKGPLENIKKEERVSDFSSSKSPKISSLNKPIDVSKYKKVKLVDAVLETLAHSDLLKSSREKVIQYDLKLKNAIADFYPTIDAEYNYGRTRTEPGSLEGERFKFFKDKNYKLVLRQNLYSGGASLNNVKSVRKKLEVAENQYKITLDKEVKKAIKAYFGVVFSNRSVMVNERNMKKLKKILEIVTIKYDNGAASIGDLTSIKANVANAMTKLVKVNSKFVESLRYYEYIVGTNFEKTLPYEKNFDVSITDFDELYKRALENNRGLINYYKSIEDEKFSQRKARASFKPKIDFELSYKKTMDAEDLEVEEKDINGKIKLSYNIFNGGKDKNKVLEVNSKIRDLNYRLEEEKKKLKWNLSKVHTSVTSVLEALKSTITEVKASRKMVGAYWDAFKLGEQDLSSLLQGQRQLNTAETELVKYEESHITDFFNILELTGDLSSFFDVDPENPKFIDFTKSDYKKSIIAKDGDNLDIDLKSEQKKELEDFNKKDLVKKEEIKNIPLPKTSMNENINKYLEEFLKFDDESFMIEISSFGNIYDSFDFIKNNNLDTNSFSYDVVKKYNIETRVAHNNFKTISEAEEYLKALKSKKLDKKYEIKKVKDIKTLYNKYIDGLKIKVQKQKTKIKIVEKIRQAVKKEEFKTDEEFKNKFLNSKENDFTINLSSFTDIEKLEEFIKSNGIYKESFFFRYGDSGRLIKLVFGVYSNYASLESKLNSFILENDNIYPIVEKISLVKKQYKENIDLNIKKEEPITYEYINLSKNEAKKLSNKTEKNKKIKEVDKNDDLLILTKRPNIDDINKKEKEELKEIKKKIEEILPTKKDKIEKKLELKSEKKIIEESVNKKEEIKDGSFESKFLNTPENYYTTNLASFSDMELAKKFVKNNKIKDNTILVISNSGKILVTHGVYSTREKALTSISSLPEKIKENKPFIQKIIWTQKSYIKNNLKENLSEKNKKDELEAKKLEEEKKLEELRLKKLEEEKAKKLEDEKKLAEIKKAEEKRIEEEKAKKLEEEKKSKELRLKKQEELKKAEEIRIEEEKAKKLENKVKKLDNSFESKFLNAPENYYTTNLASFSNIKLAKKFVKNNKIEDNTILVISNSGKILVTYGVYSTRKKALDAISSLPAKIKENKPFIQKIVWTQRSYKKNNLKENLSEKNKKDKLEEKRIEEEKKSKELRLKKLEEEKAKKLEEKKLAELKKAEEKRIEEEKAKKLEEEKKLAEIKKQKELKKTKELRLKKLAEEKMKRIAEAKKMAAEKAKKFMEEKRLREIKKQEKAKKVQEQAREFAEQKRIAEEKAKKIIEEKKLAEIKKQEEIKKMEELRLKKLAEQKRIAKEKSKKIAEQKIEDDRLRKIAESKKIEKLKKAEELRLKKIAEEKAKKLAEAKRVLEIKKQEEINLFKTKKTDMPKYENKSIISNKPIEEVDFANGLTSVKRIEIPYAQRLQNFKKKFYDTSKNNYTLKLTTIDSNKVSWYTHRFGIDPNYVVIVKKANKSTIYYGIFTSISEAKKKTETLHPLIYESNPPVKKIGSVL